MRWKITRTTRGFFLLSCDGEPVIECDDVNLLLSFYGEVTGHSALALAS